MSTDEAASEVTALSDEVTRAWFDADPLRASLLGVHDRAGELPDLSEATERAVAERMRELAAAAGRIDRPALEEAGRLTLDVAAAFAEQTALFSDARRPEWQVTDLFVAPASAMLIFLPIVTFPEPAPAAAYPERLRRLAAYLGTAADRHRAGIDAGRTPVARLVRAAVRQVDEYLALPPAEDPLARPKPPQRWAGVEGWRIDVEAMLGNVVRPAFRRYRDVLADEIGRCGRADDAVGLCWLPGGDELYRTLVRAHTTTERTPEELHQIGLEIVARLAEEYAGLGGRVFGSTDPGAVMARLREDPALRFADAAEIVPMARSAVARAEEAAPRWFGRLPRERCRVEAVPQAEAPRAPGAYYEPAALDGTRPGTYFQNTSDPSRFPRHVLEFTAHHEAVPGHHFQISLAHGMKAMPLLRRIAEFTAYDEGWALYCERLADEMDLYSSDLDRLGMLTGDSMRAGRLVVDTGMHALGWSRQRAVDFMRTNTPLTAAEIEVEVDRYIADPGQALAYMVGRLEIQRMRAEAERRLGDRFDIRSFHDTVLGSGSLPLPVLADLVGRWVGTQEK